MNERTSDIIVWGGFPHPDPVMRHAPVSVQLPPPLWRRVLHHLSVQDAAWGAWLGDVAVQTLRDALQRDLAHDAPRGDSPLAIPTSVLESIHGTLRASFWQPLAIWFGTGDSKSDGYYRLILTNGAIAVLRPSPADPSRLSLEDLFFTQARMAQEIGDMRRRQVVSRTLERFATFDPTRGEFKRHGTRRTTTAHPVRFVEPRIWNDLPACDPPAEHVTPSELAEKIGFERLFDVSAAPSAAPITDESAAHAARDLSQQLKKWTEVAADLAGTLDDSSDAYRQELCLSLLENRMSAWARFVAIDETFAAQVDTAADMNPDLAGGIDAVMAAMESFDEALQAAELFWAPIAGRSELLKNCQARLAGPHRLSLPWFLTPAAPTGARVRTAYYRLG